MLHIKDSRDACDTRLAVLAMHFSQQTDMNLYIYNKVFTYGDPDMHFAKQMLVWSNEIGIWSEENKEKNSNGKVRKLSQNRHRTQINIMLQ